MDANSYQHQRLEVGDKNVWIRILHLESPIQAAGLATIDGSNHTHLKRSEDLSTEAKIRCRVTIGSLYSWAGDFTALAYTWGDQAKIHSVFLDGQRAFIPANLYEALVDHQSELRPDEERWLWIDAICINQDDNEEKSRHK